jgi:hypothetical protein
LEHPIDEAKRQWFGQDATKAANNAVQEFWEGLRAGIEQWGLEWKRVCLYQDALPTTGDPERRIEHRIVEDLANKGSMNHQILQWMIRQGGTLIGTESTELILKEYELVRKSLAEGRTWGDAQGDRTTEQESLLARRDQFIADRIAETLHADGLGILFIGMLHRVQDYLSADIFVDYPFGRPKLEVSLIDHPGRS